VPIWFFVKLKKLVALIIEVVVNPMGLPRGRRAYFGLSMVFRGSALSRLLVGHFSDFSKNEIV
jgi:hypothetical protein